MTSKESKLFYMHWLLLRLSYDRDLGEFYWAGNAPVSCAGKLAGGIDFSGYRVIAFHGQRIKAHRLVWLVEHGELPELLDHINGIRHDNRISNLRPATAITNGRNRIEHRRGQLIGTTRRRDGRWMAQYWIRGKKVYAGDFPTMEEAHVAYTEHRLRKES